MNLSFRRTLLKKVAVSQIVPIERYVSGTATPNTNVGMSLDGGDDYIRANVDSNGEWRIDIPQGENITTLEGAFSADNFNGNYNLISVDLTHIGSLINCTSMAEMFKGCTALTEVRFANNVNTPNLTNMTAMFNSCTSLRQLDVSMINTSAIPSTSAVTGMSNFLYMYQVGSLEELSLPEIRVYVSSNFFYNCSNLTTIHRCGTIHQRFKIYECPLDRASAIVLLNALSNTPPSTNPNIHFHPDTYQLLNSTDIAIATAKGWNVVSGN